MNKPNNKDVGKRITIKELAEMVAKGFYEVGQRFDVVEADIKVLKEDMVEVKAAVRKIGEIDSLRDRVVILEKKHL